jgi:signal transduction histidine kinase
MTSTTLLLRAVTRAGFLRSAWPWRGVAYAATTAIVSGLVWLVLAVPLAPIALSVEELRTGRWTGTEVLLAATLGLFGVCLLAIVGPPLAVVVARVERWRLRLADDSPALSRRAGDLYRDPATWRAVAYLLLLTVVAPLWLGVLTLVGLLVGSTPFAAYQRIVEQAAAGSVAGRIALGLVLIPVGIYLASAFGGTHAALARMLLCREPDPAEAELVEVSRSRARMADAFEAERWRIERDLHDIAQQRLVSLSLQLGLARSELPADLPATAAVASAHEQAKTLMVELRNLVRGISPRTLRELGLRDAVEELAAASPLRVRVEVGPGRFPAAVEAVAFAAASEALTNAVKHASASEVDVMMRSNGGTLTVQVRDDGRGGADPAHGTGLTGLADRAAAAGGRLLLSSPPGGPTILRVELPCAS